MTQAEKESILPSKRFVHATFWLAHIGLVTGISLVQPQGSGGRDLLAVTMFGLGVVSIFGYYIAIGYYVNRLGRSAIVWGGLTLITSPIGVWISYFMLPWLEQKSKIE